jgi:hypothetical protein
VAGEINPSGFALKVENGIPFSVRSVWGDSEIKKGEE